VLGLKQADRDAVYCGERLSLLRPAEFREVILFKPVGIGGDDLQWREMEHFTPRAKREE
jgi:hypothetical protein